MSRQQNRNYNYVPQSVCAIALLLITLEVPTDDGPLQFQTWCIGKTPKKALAEWGEANPSLLAVMREHVVVTKSLNPPPEDTP